MNEIIDLLRQFHHGEPSAAAATSPPHGDILPALLNPYRDASAIRYQYPLYLVPPGMEATKQIAIPLAEHLSDSISDFAPGDDDARILKDNLAWMERYLRQKLEGPDPVDAPVLFADAAAALQDHLDLSEDSREKLGVDLDRLGNAIKEGGTFLGYGSDVPLHLLVHAIRHRAKSRHDAFREQIDKSKYGLESLLQVEQAKNANANKPGSVEKSVGPAARHLDTSALSDLLDKRIHGSVEMSAERRARIERALNDLQSWQEDPVLVRFVGKVDNPWFGKQASIDVLADGDPCAKAAATFEQDAARFAKLFAAIRIAKLEVEDRYDPAIHNSWFDAFDWQAFSDDEQQLVTRVIAIVSADHLAGDGLPSFSHLLGSRMPVHVLSWVRAYDNPAVRPGEGPFDAWRFELAYFGVGHRQVVVSQTSAARHQDLLSGFLCALETNRTSLHLVNRGTQTKTRKPLLDPWFVASAALEGRAHPFLLVNPDAGDHAAQRVSFGGNPQPENDWPVETLEYRGEDGEVTEMELAFTFADYALLMPALHEHFRAVPKGFESGELLPVAEYLDISDDSVDRLVPFVWGIDDQGELIRFVVSRALVFACRDRLNFWHTLQELAGIHNFYVETAVDRVVEEQREQLLKEHEEQLENVRAEAAGEAVGKLVDVLMGADLSAVISEGNPPASMPAAEPAATVAKAEALAQSEAEAEAAREPEEEASIEEPWLDSEACTTCDDCMGINKMMFAYNDNKQAYITDPRAGSYADLVEAAEICPAKCIHPGTPLDPNETGLKELMARAAPFN
ncbi:MAG: ferredoxin [Woeseiaceae bacterium]|nr:ferredoxin [Woeseiaceae bacterium]